MTVKQILHRFSSFMLARQKPDAKARAAVKAVLASRESLPMDRLYEQHWQRFRVSRQIVEFVYRALGNYSGLDFSRVVPADSLHDLKFDQVCWSDWVLDFREDLRKYGIDLFAAEQLLKASTISEIVLAICELERRGPGAAS